MPCLEALLPARVMLMCADAPLGCQDAEQDRYLDALAPSDRARLLGALDQMGVPDAKAYPTPRSTAFDDDREYNDPDFVAGVVRKLSGMPPARQDLFLKTLSPFARRQIDEAITAQMQRPASPSFSDRPDRRCAHLRCPHACAEPAVHELSLSSTPPPPANRLFQDEPTQPSSSSSYWQDSADFQPIRRQRTAVQRSAAPRPAMQRSAAMPTAAVQQSAEKYIEDTFPLVDFFGQTFKEGMGGTSPAREQRRAQRSTAPPPVSLRAPKAAAEGPQTAGIGINFVVDSSDCLVIGSQSLVPGGPAERKGTLREGDALISVDGLHLMGQRLVFDDVLNMVRGAHGSDVILEFERPGKSERPNAHNVHT